MEKIVVGVDGSPAATFALRWAVREAMRHDASVTALFACGPDEVEATDRLAGWVRAAGFDTETVAVHAVHDDPDSALLTASAWADLVVVGARGHGGFTHRLVGGVSTAVAERASCPVAVIHGTGQQTGPVVVGIDGWKRSAGALQWAANEARLRRAPLEVVHACDALGHDAVATRAMRAADLSGVAVHAHVVGGTPAAELVKLSRTASVVVVGSRGRSDVAAMLLGSVSRDVLHHSLAPVVVVRAS